MTILITCPCGKKLSVPDEHAGKRGKCPACGQVLAIPAPGVAVETPPAADYRWAPSVSSPAPAATSRVVSPPSIPVAATPPLANTTPRPSARPSSARTCAICQSPIGPREVTKDCPGCGAPYHAECWGENQGCAVYGCDQVPPVEGHSTLEIPVSFWGQEEKPCPACRRTILAAAVRCRHCGATFESIRPETSHEFVDRAQRNMRAPALRRTIVWLFVLAVIPCTAPFIAVISPIWYFPRRQEVQGLSGVYVGLTWMAMGISALLSVTVILMTLLYSVART